EPAVARDIRFKIFNQSLECQGNQGMPWALYDHARPHACPDRAGRAHRLRHDLGDRGPRPADADGRSLTDPAELQRAALRRLEPDPARRAADLPWPRTGRGVERREELLGRVAEL